MTTFMNLIGYGLLVSNFVMALLLFILFNIIKMIKSNNYIIYPKLQKVVIIILILVIFSVVLYISSFMAYKLLPNSVLSSIASILTALSVSFVAWQSWETRRSNTITQSHNDIAAQRDKKKMSVKVISRFNDLVVSTLRTFDKDDTPKAVHDAYSIIRSVIRLYAYIDSGLTNNKILRKYTYNDLRSAAKKIHPYVRYFLNNTVFKEATIRFIHVLKCNGIEVDTHDRR